MRATLHDEGATCSECGGQWSMKQIYPPHDPSPQVAGRVLAMGVMPAVTFFGLSLLFGSFMCLSTRSNESFGMLIIGAAVAAFIMCFIVSFAIEKETRPPETSKRENDSLPMIIAAVVFANVAIILMPLMCCLSWSR